MKLLYYFNLVWNKSGKIDNIMEELEAKIKDLDLEQANMIVEEEGKILRVTKQDDNFLICTCDYCTHRVNVEVIKNKVVKILSVG